MNDYWNDPPEEREYDPEHVPQPPIEEEPPFDRYEEYELIREVEDERRHPPRCPHGREHGSCDACDYAADLAFDAARERGRR